MSEPHFQGACFFLDIGQGTSQVLYFGEGRGIVIDGGPSGEVPLLLLDRYVDTIHALIVSHNDADHHRGAFQILERSMGTLEDVYFLEDRPFDRIGLYELAERRLRAGSIRRVIRLERSDRSHVLYEDPQKDLTLDLLYPEFLDNLAGREQNDPNATSAVLALHCGTSRVLFPGDSKIETWRRIRRRLGGPVRCDVSAVPHHGGVVWDQVGEERDPGGDSPRGVTDQLRWLYREAIVCKYAIISTGTHNRYGHPRPEVVRAIREAGGRHSSVLCTQLTPNCCNQSLLEDFESGIIPLNSLSASYLDGIKRGKDVQSIACAGTVLVRIGPDCVAIDPLEQHQARITALQGIPDWHPLCRP
jgi:glyoxylase-like metal-dependent hydrolase (beta-lactamase superfamily II)